MNEKDFIISKEDVKNLLKDINLLRNSDFYKKKLIPQLIKIKEKRDYLLNYQEAVKKFNYHFMLSDESFLKFECIKDEKGSLILRYYYFGFPYNLPTYNEYLIDKGKNFNVVGYSDKDEYEQLIVESKEKDPITLIRYDYSEKNYLPGIHSASHFHIGYGNSMRISCSKMITPLLFTLFILKQVYYDEWKILISNEKIIKSYKSLKSKCKEIDKKIFQDIDRKELFLD